MDARVNQFLSDCNLRQYRENFVLFDFQSFINLSSETINAFISNKSDSDKLYKAISSFINGSDDMEPVVVKTESDSSIDGYDVYEISSVDSVSAENVTLEEQNPPVIVDPQRPNLIIKKIPITENTVSLNKPIHQEPEDVEMVSNRDDEDDEEEMDFEKGIRELKAQSLSKRKQYVFRKTVKSLKLSDIRDLNMRILLAIYRINKKFNIGERTLLSEIIIKKILIEDTTRLLEKKGFLVLAKLVLETFPEEPMDAYFRDIEGFNSSHYFADRGSLYTAYKKYQTILAKSGFPIAKPRPKRGPSRKKGRMKSVPGTETASNVSNSVTEFENDLEKQFMETRKYRLKLVAQWQANGQFSTVRYMEKYKILQQENGYEWIVRDAHYLQPYVAGFTPKFIKTARNIIQYAKELKWNDEYILDLLKFAKPKMSDDSARFMAILLLPYVLPNSAINTKTQAEIKSPLMSAVQFVRLFKDAADETRVYQQLYLEDETFLAGVIDVNLKMFGDFDNINSIALKVGSVTYQFSDPLKAIEAYFKIFLGLHQSYPIYAGHIFDFFGTIGFALPKKPTMNWLTSYYKKFTGNH